MHQSRKVNLLLTCSCGSDHNNSHIKPAGERCTGEPNGASLNHRNTILSSSVTSIRKSKCLGKVYNKLSRVSKSPVSYNEEIRKSMNPA